MDKPATRIRFARQIAARFSQTSAAGLIAAEAVRLVRDLGTSPEFAARHASARAVTILALEARP
ncbi:hypothetical protein [Thiocystis violacea]|uniref:hypothetical protein n=1 Tax=Thiocystis violacea TaxID=13725 RepID=UPI00190619F6|nr:hypothetical protein [Thiocystis violacea]MBK1719192.1 hypothetical protein [Thiocystis violacea]